MQRYATALDITTGYVNELAETAHGHIQEALADMTRQNLLSVTGKAWNLDDASGWLLPYEGDQADPELTARMKVWRVRPRARSAARSTTGTPATASPSPARRRP